MIPLPKREKLLVLLRQGTDVRRACKESGITRSNLYKYFNEFPTFKQEVAEVMHLADEDVRKAEEQFLKDDLERIKKRITGKE